MTRDPRGKLGNTELALAYELHTAGINWRHIASGLGISVHYLRARVKQAERQGLRQQ
ncbi:hypothetical protein [Pseudomonas nicosulfuronedens]